jgi:hypothetical protein
MARTSTYFQLLDLAYKLESASKRVTTYKDSIEGGIFTHNEGQEESVLLTSVVIVDSNLYQGLPMGAIKLLLFRIQPEMKMNNVFWVAGKVDSNTRTAIAALKKAEILIPAAEVGHYIINPFKLRRGKSLSAITASLQHLSETNGVSLPLTDLRAPKTMSLPMMQGL